MTDMDKEILLRKIELLKKRMESENILSASGTIIGRMHIPTSFSITIETLNRWLHNNSIHSEPPKIWVDRMIAMNDIWKKLPRKK